MSRTKDENTKWKMRLFVTAGRRYAVTINPGVGASGKRCSNISIWGLLSEDLKFSPNLRFVLLSMQEKKKYIFPEDWDITDAFKAADNSGSEEDVYKGEDKYLIYGDTLFLDKITQSCKLQEDLEEVFGKEETSKILTIAYFWLISEKNLNRLEKEFAVQWFPSEEVMNPSFITRFSQSITKEKIDRFMAIRKKRYEENGQWYGIDSTSISNYSSSLADARWGKNKEHDLCKQLNLMVMYDMVSELPAHYRSLPGNIPDARTLRLLIEELKSAEFNNFGFILDRAYLTKENLDLFVPKGIKSIFMAKTNDKIIKQEIIKSSESIRSVENYLPEFDCYGKECVYPYSFKETEGKGKGTDVNQRLCLYFDPELQGAEEKALSKQVLEETAYLKEYKQSKTEVDEKIIKKLAKHFDITTDENGRVTSYSVSSEKINEKRSLCGYFAMVCCNLPKEERSIDWVLSTYRKRDLQEKAFTYLKTWQNGRRLRTSTELSTEGRIFFQFVTLIINCQLHHLYFKSKEDFRKKFDSPWEILDEMRSVRLVRLKNRKEKVSEFVGKQVDIFDEFGFDIPQGCRPVSKKKPKTKA